MLKVTPPAPAAEERLTVKVNEVVPALPSASVTSLIERLGCPPPPQTFKAVAVLRGFGALAVKSVELLSVSVQPFMALISAVVVEGAGALAVSLQLAVVPKPTKSIILAPVGHAPLK